MTSPSNHGARYRQLPLWRAASLLAVENAVRHFPRYHKYLHSGKKRRQLVALWPVWPRATSVHGGAQTPVPASTPLIPVALS